MPEQEKSTSETALPSSDRQQKNIDDPLLAIERERKRVRPGTPIAAAFDTAEQALRDLGFA